VSYPDEDRRAPVQGDGNWRLPHRSDQPTHDPGTIAWTEHEEVWAKYSKRYGSDQSAERIAERGGFSFFEAEELLGRPLSTWRPL